MGIKFFQIPYFQEAKAIGCTSKFSSGQAAICVSSVENRPDILLFALFRGITHLREEQARETAIDYCSAEDQLIDERLFERLSQKGDFRTEAASSQRKFRPS
ncbi:MAG: hypothetical protein M0Q94_09050 [Candidatus Cloacimonetes bacterium]|nr:hypothetical protein [Candidatus Cloacimonadota bacterium]